MIGIQANPSAPPSWLQPHEEMVWVGETQYGNRGWGGGLIVSLFGVLLVLAGLFGSSFGVTLVGAVFFIVGSPLAYAGIKQGGTRFYLTGFRFVRATRYHSKPNLQTDLSRKEPCSIPPHNPGTLRQ